MQELQFVDSKAQLLHTPCLETKNLVCQQSYVSSATYRPKLWQCAQTIRSVYIGVSLAFIVHDSCNVLCEQLFEVAPCRANQLAQVELHS